MKNLIAFIFSVLLLGSCTKSTYCVDCVEFYTAMETQRCGLESDEADAWITNLNSANSSVWICDKYIE